MLSDVPNLSLSTDGNAMPPLKVDASFLRESDVSLLFLREMLKNSTKNKGINEQAERRQLFDRLTNVLGVVEDVRSFGIIAECVKLVLREKV